MRIARLATIILSTSTLLTAASCGQKTASASDEVTSAESLMLSAKETPQADISIQKKWTMPADLLEISGISWMDDQRIACVQDERGSLFIYNLTSSKVEKEIPFAPAGDYEAISKAGNRFYVMRSDGHIFELDPSAKNPVVKEFDAKWSNKHDIEAMSYDEAGKRLLIADKVGGSGNICSIYAFDLRSGKMGSTPVYQIDLSSLAAEDDKGKKGKRKKGGKKNDKKGGKDLQPSAMAANPRTGDIYITDGGESTLLVLDRNWKPKQFIKLDKSDFPQPEGLTVSPKGEVFISSEGAKGKGVIARVTL